jgi:teichuronic acid biosynthesis glycosyltransferase TuaC
LFLEFQRHGSQREKRMTSRLHVLTLTPFYPSCRDEVSGCYVAEPLDQLQARGVASSVIAVSSIYHASRKPNSMYPAEWVRYAQLPGNLGLPSAGKFLYAALLSKVAGLHRNSPINVIHAHASLPCGHAAAMLSHRLGIPFVVTIHGLDVFNSCVENGIAASWRKAVSRHVYQRAGKVICISDKVQQMLTNGMDSGSNSKVIYNGVDSSRFAPCSSNAAPAILMVGNLLAGKGHELVFRAMARSKDLLPGLQCHVIGEGGDRARFADLARRLGIADRVHFLGLRGRSEVAEAMRSCSLFVLPSRYEGLGCVYLEAMACAKPVIACRGQGIDEIIEHGNNGWLIPVDGLEELVQGIHILLNDAGLRARIGEAARQTIVGNYTLQHQAERLFKTYEEVA